MRKVIPTALDKDKPEINIQSDNSSFIGNGEVTILPKKDSWNREEVKSLYKQFREDKKECAVIGGAPYWAFDEWLDKNY